MLALLVALGTVGLQGPSCGAHLDDTSTPLDSAVVAAMRDFSVPGAAVAVVRDGRVIQLGGHGCANIERGIGVDPRATVFRAARDDAFHVRSATCVGTAA